MGAWAGLQEGFLLQECIAALYWFSQRSCEISIRGDCQEVGGQSHFWPGLVVVTVTLGAAGWATDSRGPFQPVVLWPYGGAVKQCYAAGVNQILFLLSGDALPFGNAFCAQEKVYQAVCRGKPRAWALFSEKREDVGGTLLTWICNMLSFLTAGFHLLNHLLK